MSITEAKFWNILILVAGSSTNPALDTYAGPGPFSEPETRSLSTYIASIADKIDLYIATHSFGHLLLLPFGNSTQPYGNYHDAVSTRNFVFILGTQLPLFYLVSIFCIVIIHAQNYLF